MEFNLDLLVGRWVWYLLRVCSGVVFFVGLKTDGDFGGGES